MSIPVLAALDLIRDLERTGLSKHVPTVRALLELQEREEARLAKQRDAKRSKRSGAKVSMDKAEVSRDTSRDRPPDRHRLSTDPSRDLSTDSPPQTPLSDQKDLSSYDLSKRGGSDLHVQGHQVSRDKVSTDNVEPIRRLTWHRVYALWAEHWHKATATTAPPAGRSEQACTAIMQTALEAARGDHARAWELVDAAWTVGWADRWWERKGQRVPLFGHFAERFSQYLAEVVEHDTHQSDDGFDLNESGNPVFLERDGESPADRAKRLREYNRRIAAEMGG